MTRGFLTKLRFAVPARWRRFGGAREGVAAVEFAMVLPLMLTMWLGTVEVGQAISINRKSSQVSRTLADLSARATAITNAEMNNIFAATTAVLAPYDPARLGMTVASIKLVAVGQARVIWSESRGLNPPSMPVNSTVTLPAGLLTELNRTIIIGETNYQYMPTVGWIVSKSGFNVNEKTYMVPRQVPEVTRIP